MGLGESSEHNEVVNLQKLLWKWWLVVNMDSGQHTENDQYNGDGQDRGLTVQGLGNHMHVSTYDQFLS